MKKLIFLIGSFVLTTMLYPQQFPESYPFETYLDAYSNLYVTGDYNGDILIARFNSEGELDVNAVYPNSGVDKGMDIVANANGTMIYAVGYINNVTTNDDIIILKYSIANNGTLLWHAEYDNISNIDRGLGITIDVDENVYICGFVTNSDNTIDYIVIKYDEDGNFLHDRKYELIGNEVATDILTDNNYVYAIGNADEISGIAVTTKDVMLLALDLNLNNPVSTVISIPSTTQIPTSFMFTEMGDNNIPPAKSQLAIGGFSESINRIITYDYFIGHFTVNVLDNQNVVDWYKSWGVAGYDDVGTGITTDDDNNIVVTGYHYNSGNHDFATLKYDLIDSNLIWGPYLYDYNDGIDRASSVCRIGNLYAVSGYSQLNPINNFVTQTFAENQGNIEDGWTNVYQPAFLQGNNVPNYTEFGTKSYILSDSSVITVVFAWNNQVSDYAIVKFDKNGEIIYSVEDGDNITNNGFSSSTINGIKSFELKQNYPNPFNPSTVISYSVPAQSYVTLKVYDLLGREISELVNANQGAGSYNVRFDGSNLASGIYIYKLTAISGNTRFEKTEKMTLVK